jgi:glucose repression regulatory protein TUP1
MYPHRGLPNSAARLNELLDQIRTEFDNQMRVNEGYEQQSRYSTRAIRV